VIPAPYYKNIHPASVMVQRFFDARLSDAALLNNQLLTESKVFKNDVLFASECHVLKKVLSKG